MKLIVSREARVLAGKHAWNCYGRSAYGVLVGSRFRLIVSLPVSSVRAWGDFDAGSFASDVLPLARQLADLFHLQTIGFYASSGMGVEEAGRCPLRSQSFFMEYYMECCPQCSWAIYYRNGKRLPGDRVAVCVGRRLTDTINQKRILSRWNHLLGRTSYLDDQS